jgi:hypothetical protein
MSVEITRTEKITQLFQVHSLDIQGADRDFVTRFHTGLPKIQGLFQELYGVHEEADSQLIELLRSERRVASRARSKQGR